MPGKGSPGLGPARPFQVRFDIERRQWAVYQGARWRFTRSLCLQVTTLSNHNELTGVGVVRTLQRGDIVITA